MYPHIFGHWDEVTGIDFDNRKYDHMLNIQHNLLMRMKVNDDCKPLSLDS